MLIPAGSRKKPKSVTDGLNVRRRQCKKCLFGKDPLIVGLQRRNKIEVCLRTDRTFTYHEFDNVTCRGFYDKHKRDVIPTRIAIFLNAIIWVD